MRLFITFSPKQRTGIVAYVNYVYHQVIRFLEENNIAYKGTTSWGCMGTHYHFHFAVLNVNYTRADAFRRRVFQVNNWDKDTFPESQFVFQRMKGSIHDVEAYLVKNYEQGNNNWLTYNKKYDIKMNEILQEERVLTNHIYYMLLSRKARAFIANQPSRKSYTLPIAAWYNELLDQGYLFYNIRTEDIAKVETQIVATYGGLRRLL